MPPGDIPVVYYVTIHKVQRPIKTTRLPKKRGWDVTLFSYVCPWNENIVVERETWTLKMLYFQLWKLWVFEKKRQDILVFEKTPFLTVDQLFCLPVLPLGVLFTFISIKNFQYREMYSFTKTKNQNQN